VLDRPPCNPHYSRRSAVARPAGDRAPRCLARGSCRTWQGALNGFARSARAWAAKMARAAWTRTAPEAPAPSPPDRRTRNGAHPGTGKPQPGLFSPAASSGCSFPCRNLLRQITGPGVARRPGAPGRAPARGVGRATHGLSERNYCRIDLERPRPGNEGAIGFMTAWSVPRQGQAHSNRLACEHDFKKFLPRMNDLIPASLRLSPTSPRRPPPPDAGLSRAWPGRRRRSTFDSCPSPET